MNLSIIYDKICSLIPNKCHPKSHYNDIKYHMTLNIIFNIIVGTPLFLILLIPGLHIDLDQLENEATLCFTLMATSELSFFSFFLSYILQD